MFPRGVWECLHCFLSFFFFFLFILQHWFPWLWLPGHLSIPLPHLFCSFMSLVPSLKWVSGACTLPGSGWWCPRPIREGGMFPTRGSHSPLWLPLFCGLFFLVTTSSDHHLGPCFPSLTTGLHLHSIPKKKGGWEEKIYSYNWTIAEREVGLWITL